MRIWLQAIALFVVGTLLIGSLVWTHYQQRRSDHLEMHQVAFSSSYDSIIHTFRLVSQTIVEESIQQETVLQNINAIVTANGEQQNYQRGLLYRRLYPLYARISRHSIRQLHFYFADGRSLLRFHVPEHANDDLNPFRPSMVIANKQQREVHGYGSGRFVHGYRHIYPLNYQQRHLGCVGISNSFAQIKHELLRDSEQRDIDYMFIMLKEDFWHKLAPRQERLYVESPLSADYMAENSQAGVYANLGGTATTSAQSTAILTQLRGNSQLQAGLASKADFCLVTSFNNKDYVVIFRSIKNIEGHHAAYIVKVQRELYLQSFNHTASATFIVMLVLLALLLYVWKNLKQVRIKQQREHAFIETITSNMGEGLYVTDSKRIVTYANDEAVRLLGYTKDEALNKNAHNLFHAGDLESPEPGCPILSSVLNDKSYQQQQNTFRNKNGEIFPVELTSTPIHKKRQIYGIITLFKDITQRKSKEAERQSLESQLRQKHKMEAMGYMAGGIAHNFNNCLAIIMGNVELTQMELPADSKVMPLLENAKTAVRRSRDLVRKISTYNKAGLQDKTTTQLQEIIAEAVSLLQSTLPSTITLNTVYSPDCATLLVNADVTQIQEVMLNLCNNAVKAMDEKGELQIALQPVHLSAVDIPAQYDCQPGKYANLSVQDNGCGMSADMLNKIFDPFYSTKEEYEGAGMGLATVHGIVSQHGGLIKVISAVGKGTVFLLYFPIIEQPQIDEQSSDNTA